MRTRLALLLVLALTTVGSLAIAPAFAQDTEGDEGVVTEEDESQGQETQTGSEEGGEGQSEPEAETGAGEDEAGEASTEAGPVWTYQMSRISIVLMVLLVLGIAGAYYNFVHKRQKEGI
jgi:hypothetical protein